MSFESLGLRHFRCAVDPQGIAWLTIDCAGSSVNRLSGEVLAELGRALDHFQSAPPAALVIRSGKAAGFVAGADIDEFSQLNDAATARAFIERGWTVFNRLAAVPWPTLALIQGHCMGGGLELALACRYRIVVDQPDTRLSLPEVMLGIFPGWGGMLRLPRRVGAPLALDMMLTGRALDARRAAAAGVADLCVPPRLAEQSAARHVLSSQPVRGPKGKDAWLSHPMLRPLLLRQARKTLEKRDPQGHYPAPRAILEIWAHHAGDALDAPGLIDAIIHSDTARNLLRVFRMQERLKSFGKAGDQAPVRHVHVVGAGVMGGDIAAWCALKGLTVTLQDTDRARIAQAIGRAHALYARKIRPAREARLTADRLIPDPDGQGIARADLVIEAISENLDAKRGLYAAIEPRLKDGALLATNTSSLSLQDLGRDLAHPERLVGIHFFNPVAKMPLVEVVAADGTDPRAQSAACAFVGRIGKLPLPVKSVPGFLVNAVLAPYMLEAMRCVDEGLRPETIDAAMKAYGMPMGPIELIDTVGLDIARDAGAQLTGAEPPACLARHLARNELGRKSGQGFYRWREGKPVRAEAGTAPAGLARRLLQPLIDATRRQLAAGVVADAELANAGVIFGTGYAPYTGGPMTPDDH
ncbi:3-hydroxyacyl-CoA dehydrogenase NAD-binding domain-containing protein [Castellaniella defragrans]|uniref:Enoyl-CoA hydratase / Delta(3)-cis-delta(2)-trans-enoyl-CoA isomerase / 3-hydroxyacyl-CoA dehydrogenase / 3-hydroxybutyryl-CoA epimerase n=1 Tax=Castellaniella defragrans (strain DSM 12143 / CCUG 39792 / 65Phen) TaxID=1437824 RepID=W8X876_CASD6|nr:3-hydroxyacyl-CoA dehydrogenase NAD-binding domain-containing protein [Castellaniella defragrans]CDM22590.1 Enoyl-CoA hydratase / Delta(3)-cis-delta(2)-trans-enoyl-CoA isomerase / 3-hydroxyacyl-CoA dehydrogenase / 3-hydroxybutyryl-CoA epimerase [Castellaniella defragrans 65Phen]